MKHFHAHAIGKVKRRHRATATLTMLARLLVEAHLGGDALGLHDLAAALAVDDLRLDGAAAARLLRVAAAHASDLVGVGFLSGFFV